MEYCTFSTRYYVYEARLLQIHTNIDAFPRLRSFDYPSYVIGLLSQEIA